VRTMPKTAAFNQLFFDTNNDEARAVMIRKTISSKPA
jgi:hypothetical protein